MEWLEGIYRKLSITRGKVHKYLHITLDFWTQGELRVTIVDYLKGALGYLPEVITGIGRIPEAIIYFKLGMTTSGRY